MYKLSVFLPTIRPHLLEEWYLSLEKSCSYPFQVVFCGPFDIPLSLFARENVKFIRSYAHPTKCAQMAALECDGELIYHSTDDLFFVENQIDAAINLMEAEGYDIINMRYIESEGHSNKTSFPLNYWTASGSCPVPTIPDFFLTGGHFMISKNLFDEVGGFDCRFEYLTHAAQDLLVRLQFSGARFAHSPLDVSTADWSGASHAEDHSPIQHGQEDHDLPLYWQIWMSSAATRRIIPLDNHKMFPDRWERRFNQNNPKSYVEMLTT